MEMNSGRPPNNWVLARLDKVCDVILGQSPPGNTYNFDGKGLPFFQGKAEFGELYPHTVKWCSRPSKIAQKDDVLISVRAPVGPTNLCPEEACIGRGLAALRPRNGIPARYVLYALRSNVQLLAEQATGSTFEAISGKQLRAHTIPLAPATEQQRVVKEIEKQFTRLDAGVTSLKRVQLALKRYRASVLKAACEGRLVPTEAEVARKENRSYETGEELLQHILKERREKWNGKGKYKEPVPPNYNELPALSEGWTWATLDALAKIKGGITKDQKRKHTAAARSVPYLRVANVQRGYLDLKEVKEIVATEDEIQELALKPGDILFNEGGDRDKLGRGWVWNGELPECIHQNHVFRARPYVKELNPKLISWYANTFGQQFFFAEGKHTTNLASISMTKLKGLPVAIPPPAEQARIVVEVDRRLSVLAKLNAVASASVKRSTRLKQSILQDAYSAKLLK
jgi:type I restriction enzyme S subunit